MDIKLTLASQIIWTKNNSTRRKPNLFSSICFVQESTSSQTDVLKLLVTSRNLLMCFITFVWLKRCPQYFLMSEWNNWCFILLPNFTLHCVIFLDLVRISIPSIYHYYVFTTFQFISCATDWLALPMKLSSLLLCLCSYFINRYYFEDSFIF